MPSPEGRRLADLSLAVRQSSLKRFRAVPAGCENWRISEDSMTIADLAHHLIEADRWLFRKIQEPDLAHMVGESGRIEIGSRSEYEELLNELRSVGGERGRLLADLDDDQLDQRLPDRRFGSAAPIWWIIVRGNIDHEIHHRGQLSAYLMAMQQNSK
jgi:uncharacterized damage-inducible protein DinB